jgi:hypothetical protein
MQAERTPAPPGEAREQYRRTIAALRDAEDELRTAIRTMPEDDEPIRGVLSTVEKVANDLAEGSGVAVSIIGREKALLGQLARSLYDTARRHHNYGPIGERRRGYAFEVQILVDNEPTGHVAKVTVDLDRFEEPGR